MTTTTITAERMASKTPAGWTLKKFKEIRAMSEETLCFTADLYIGGKLACSVSNHGHGGPDMHTWHDDTLKAEAERVAAETYPEFNYGPLDVVIGDMCNELDQLKVARRDKKKGYEVTVWVKVGEYDSRVYSLPRADMLADMLSEVGAEGYRIIEV